VDTEVWRKAWRTFGEIAERIQEEREGLYGTERGGRKG
jgi:hypothetical protein